MVAYLHPAKQELNKPAFITYRRMWLDYLLTYFSSEMQGNVLDLGGKRQKKRGSFIPLETQAASWWYLNLAWDTQPNIVADVEFVPFKNNSLDCIVCTEVLEHIHHPSTCVSEIWRILRPNGVALASVPFMYPIHADPYDFQRFTDSGLRLLFSKFNQVDIMPMGGYFGTMGMLAEMGITRIQGQGIHQKLKRRSLQMLARHLYRLDLMALENQPATAGQEFTTGYFVRAKK